MRSVPTADVRSYEPDPVHDLRHRLSDLMPFARESTVYNAHIADECVLTMYTWVDAAGVAGQASCVFGPAAGSKAIFETSGDVQVPDTMDFTDWKVGDLHVQHKKPLETASVTLSGQRLQVEWDFEAMHPAFFYNASFPDDPEAGCPQFFASGRYEQSGFVKGVLHIDGRELPFDGLGHRDHSWGKRNWGMIQSLQWLEAQAEDVAVNVIVLRAQGREWCLGYVFKDGLVSPVRYAAYDISFDDRWVQDDFTVKILDADGRDTLVKATRYGRHEYPIGPSKLVDTAVAITVEGRQGLGYSDFIWPADYLRHVRATS